MITRFGLLAIGLAAVCGCQSTSNAPRDIALQPLQWTSAFPLQELAPQSVELDECGLALWTRGKEAKRIFFAVNKRRQGTINFEGQSVVLSALHERLGLVRGFAPKQLYESNDLRAALDLTIETRQDVRESAVVRSGVLTLTQISTSKSLIVPIVGLIGCS